LYAGATTHEITPEEEGKTPEGATTDACRHYYCLGRKYKFYAVFYGNVREPEKDILSAATNVNGEGRLCLV